MTIDVTFIDAGREATQRPDPRYPNGVDLDATKGEERTCTRNLPYPSPRCGMLKIVCLTCGYVAAVTVAGRADDPRTVKLPCKAVASTDGEGGASECCTTCNGSGEIDERLGGHPRSGIVACPDCRTGGATARDEGCTVTRHDDKATK